MNKLFLPFLFLSYVIFAQQKDSLAVLYSNTITEKGLSKNLHIIASDKFAGRETGKKGQKMAAAFIAKQFAAAGIPPYKENTYYQEFYLNEISPKPAEIKVNGKKYKNERYFYTYPADNEQQVIAEEILFLGYGINDKNYSDYKGVDVKNKIIMILAGEPLSEDSLYLVSGKKKESKWSGYYKVKYNQAKEMGAKALLIIVEDIDDDVVNYRHRIDRERMKLVSKTLAMPVVFISKAMANEAFQKANQIDALKKIISETKSPFHKTINAHTEIIVNNTTQKVGSENVLGYIEGGDLKEELVVITAHYDHLGKRGRKNIYNGADDDGSGTVAVIAMAEAFAKAKKEGNGPRRSILLMTVSGEEKGLLGSSYYVENPVYPLKNTVCDLNIDMIGRIDKKHEPNPDYVYLIGSDKLSTTLHAISESANKTYSNLELDYTYNDPEDINRFYYRSDHYNFAKKGIPVIFYFNGVHKDYHRVTDVVEKINFNKTMNITRLVFFTAWELANRDERIRVDSNKK